MEGSGSGEVNGEGRDSHTLSFSLSRARALDLRTGGKKGRQKEGENLWKERKKIAGRGGPVTERGRKDRGGRQEDRMGGGW